VAIESVFIRGHPCLNKKRSQFRVASRNIAARYETVETVTVGPERGCVADQPQQVELQTAACNESKAS